MKTHISILLILLCVVGLLWLVTRPFETSIDRVIVKGRVEFNGQPIDNGEILFSPLVGTGAPVAGAPIFDGNYRIEAQGGVAPGNYHVRIEAFQAADADRNTADIHSSAGPTRQQFLPKRFNEKTELLESVHSQSKPLIINFELDSVE